MTPAPSRLLALLASTTFTLAAPALADDYAQVVAHTARMTEDPIAQRLAAQRGLQVLNLTWEDTGRSKGSSVGPNISDMTIQVQTEDPRTGRSSLTCMPVIRFPNFDDRSADLALDRLQVMVGNERGLPLRRVSLREVLGNLRRYLSAPTSWTGPTRSLLAERDTHVLVSAQACFLPVPKDGSAEFNPVLFNYQSEPGDPAVLTILVTREGTSVTVIDNTRDRFEAGATWGQRLFFNQAGKRASLTAQRLSDFQASGQSATNGAALTKDPAGGLNQVLLIQIPLKTKPRARVAFQDCEGAPAPCCAPGGGEARARRSSDVEEAVVGHGKVEGPFTELAGLAIERDDRFPIRVTVQLYKATSNGVVSEEDIASIARQIEAVYEEGDAVGSLVTAGETGRPTEHAGPVVSTQTWWDDFWARHEASTGESRSDALRRLRDLVGDGWTPATPEELTDALRQAGPPPARTSSVSPAPTGADCGLVNSARARPSGAGESRTGAVAGLVAGLVVVLVAAKML